MSDSAQNLFPEELQDLVDETVKNSSDLVNYPRVEDSHLLLTLVEKFSGNFNDVSLFLRVNKVDIDIAAEAAREFMEKTRGSHRGTYVEELSNELVMSIHSAASCTKDLGLIETTPLLLLLNCVKVIELLQDNGQITSGKNMLDYINEALIEEGKSPFTPELYEVYKSKVESDSDTALDNGSPEGSIFDDLKSEEEEEVAEEKTATIKKKKKKETPALDKFTNNLSQKAEDGKLDPIVGRETEVERTIQILARKKKNNPVLVGEPGVGKTAIVEGLALRIAAGQVPENMIEKKVRSLDLTALVAGTKFRGEFEERMKVIMDELSENPEVLLFIDEIHTIVGAGNSSGQMDAANILKPALARGEMQCIGATTFKEYRESIEKDGALERRFQKVKVDAATPEEALEILINLKDSYGKHHGVSYSNEALKACVDFSIKYINDRHLPDKAIDIMDEVGSKINIANMKSSTVVKDIMKDINECKELEEIAVKNKDYDQATIFKNQVIELEKKKENAIDKLKKDRLESPAEVSLENVSEVISMMTGIPVTKLDSDELTKMKALESSIKENLIGQDKAVEEISKAIKRNRLGFDESGKPIGTFLFKGPTGVGKTQLAKELAKELFNSQDALIRIDMSEYTHKHEVSRLIGSAPGFVGYEEGGKLTEAVRQKPYSIILLDEVEKAHKDVFNIFLQVFDDGRLTDGQGRTVDFSNTVIIMTSNVGSREAQEVKGSIGFGGIPSENDDKKRGAILNKALKKTFSPEFLNRLDGVVSFNYLTKENIEAILELDLKKLTSKYSKNNYTVKFDKKAKEFLAEKGFEREFGARPLKRALKTYVDDLMVDTILDGEIKEGSSLTITHKKSEDTLSVKVTKE